MKPRPLVGDEEDESSVQEYVDTTAPSPELRALRPHRPPPYAVNVELCTGCKTCLRQFGCPALMWIEDMNQTKIDATICTGCGVCAQVCPLGAITSREVE